MALSFVGSAVYGNQEITTKVTYTDGSSDSTEPAFTDWTVGGGGGAVQYGNVTVARTPYRYISGGDKDVVDAYIFATKAFRVPDGKTIKSVTLLDNADLHVFVFAIARG